MNRRESLQTPRRLGRIGRVRYAASPRASLAQAPAPADGPFKLPPLGYPFEALEPHIDAQTMMIHHDQHHAAYVTVCNHVAKEVPDLGTTPIEQTLTDPAYIPVQLQQPVKNNLGGHWNHSFFWELMTPGGAKEPARRTEVRDRGSWKDVNEFKDKAERGGRRALRLGLGVARRQQGQEARDHLDGKPGHADRARRQGRSSASMCGSTPIT